MGENHIYEGQIVTTTPYKNWYWYFESLFWPEQIMRIKEICGTHNEDETLEVAKHVGAKTDDQVIKNIRNNIYLHSLFSNQGYLASVLQWCLYFQ